MIRQKLAFVVTGSPSVALSRMKGFSPVRIRRLASSVLIVVPSKQTRRPWHGRAANGVQCRPWLPRRREALAGLRLIGRRHLAGARGRALEQQLALARVSGQRRRALELG